MFPCTKCGLCCIMAGQSGVMPKGKNGACIYLGDNLECTIYEDRPKVCKLDENKPKEMKESDYYHVQAGYCNELQEQFELGEEYRVCLEKTLEK